MACLKRVAFSQGQSRQHVGQALAVPVLVGAAVQAAVPVLVGAAVQAVVLVLVGAAVLVAVLVLVGAAVLVAVLADRADLAAVLLRLPDNPIRRLTDLFSEQVRPPAHRLRTSFRKDPERWRLPSASRLTTVTSMSETRVPSFAISTPRVT
jgi:hypothetical protein